MREAGEERTNRDLPFDASQFHPQTLVHAKSKRGAHSARTRNVQTVSVVERRGIPVRRAKQHDHLTPSLDTSAVDFQILDSVPDGSMGGAFKAQDLVNSTLNKLRVLLKQQPLIGVS